MLVVCVVFRYLTCFGAICVNSVGIVCTWFCIVALLFLVFCFGLFACCCLLRCCVILWFLGGCVLLSRLCWLIDGLIGWCEFDGAWGEGVLRGLLWLNLFVDLDWQWCLLWLWVLLAVVLVCFCLVGAGLAG